MATLRELRKQARWSRNALGKKLGISPSMIFTVEAGKLPVPQRLVKPWAEALMVQEEEIARYVGGELRLAGLTPSQRDELRRIADEMRVGRAA